MVPAFIQENALLPSSPHLVPFCTSRQIYSEAEHSNQSSWLFFFFFLFRNRNFPQWAGFRDGTLAHHPVLVNYSRSPYPNRGIIISLKRKKKKRKEEREREKERRKRERKKESQNLKENPTSCEEILVLMSFLHLPQVFSPGYPSLRLQTFSIGIAHKLY